jgi:hypothetical protein
MYYKKEGVPGFGLWISTDGSGLLRTNERWEMLDFDSTTADLIDEWSISDLYSTSTSIDHIHYNIHHYICNTEVWLQNIWICLSLIIL